MKAINFNLMLNDQEHPILENSHFSFRNSHMVLENSKLIFGKSGKCCIRE